MTSATEQDAKAGMSQLKRDVTSGSGKAGVSKEELLIPVPYLEQGGIRLADSVSIALHLMGTEC